MTFKYRLYFKNMGFIKKKSNFVSWTYKVYTENVNFYDFKMIPAKSHLKVSHVFKNIILVEIVHLV